jgi:2-desacetyl-2-hydroxyethyl bacteriochlorophyllide A dehydrogenase
MVMTVGTRVMVYDGPHRMHIEERDVGDPGPGEVRLRISHVGICGSDLHGYTGESGRRVPGMVMGHEASGWVETIGPSVEGLAVGDAVTFNPALPCDGRCGHLVENQCAELRVVGVTPALQGAFADAMVVEAARVVPLGSLDVATGALVEPMAVAMQAVQRCGVRPDDDVAVVGGGMIGQCIAHAARLAGARSVVVTEAMEERRALAEAGGFAAVAPDGLPDRGPFDRAFDAVGVSATAAAAIRAVRKGGTVCFVGLGLPEVAIPLFEVVVAERSIVGSFCYTDEVFAGTFDLLAGGDLDLSVLVGGTVSLEDTPAAFEDLATGVRRDVKIVMATAASRPGASHG